MHSDELTGRLLIIDDNPEGSERLLKCLEKGWALQIISDYRAEHFDKQVSAILEHESSSQFQAVLVDLGLPPLPNNHTVGLGLIEKIRETWDEIPIVAYTGISLGFQEVVRRLLIKRASLFSFRHPGGQNDLCQAMPLICSGYLIYSPGPAAVIPGVADYPRDPFGGKAKWWEALRLISENPNKSYSAIENEMNWGKGVLTDRLEKIKDALGNRLSDRERRSLEQWYKENHLRYGF